MASSHPPPRAKPFIVAITGIGKVSIFLKTSFPFFRIFQLQPFVALTSSENVSLATNDFSPAPVRITALTASKSILLKLT